MKRRLQINFSPFPVLETERLVLRRVVRSDVEDFFAIRSNPDVMHYILRPLATSYADVLAVIDVIDNLIATETGINWAITLKGEDRQIGTIGYLNINESSHRAEVGFVMNADYQRMGYTMEALKAVLDYGFSEMKLHVIEAMVNPENKASYLLLEKAGFTRAALFQDYKYHNGKYVDACIYTLMEPA
jgi:[ribosomal protein S5]-alanine N-acetyltransferase